MQANDGGLETVMVRRGDKFAAETADADAFEIALGLFEFDFLRPVKCLQGSAAQQMLSGFITSEKQSAIGAHEKTGSALGGAGETRVEAVSAGQH